MHEKLKQYFGKAAENENKLTAQKLISSGLYEKVYSESNEYSSEYPESEWDDEAKTQKYFKKVPIQLTDEELEKFNKVYAASTLTPRNPIAYTLTAIAILLYIGGAIAGIGLGISMGSYGEFAFVPALACWAGVLISGTVFLGFAEIINLLNDIKNK